MIKVQPIGRIDGIPDQFIEQINDRLRRLPGVEKTSEVVNNITQIIRGGGGGGTIARSILEK